MRSEFYWEFDVFFSSIPSDDMKTRSAKKAKTTPKRTTEIKSAKKSRQSTASAGSEKMQKAQIQSRRSTYF